MIQAADLKNCIETEDTDQFNKLLQTHLQLASPKIDLTALLILAILQRKMPFIQALVAAGVDVNTPKSIYPFSTPLMAAAYIGYEEGVDYLLAHGGTDTINYKNKFGNTALLLAAIEGNAGIAQKLIRHGADVNAVGRGNATPITNAKGFGHFKLVEILIAEGADPKQAEVSPVSQGIILQKFLQYLRLQAEKSPALYPPESITSIAAVIDEGQCSGFRDLWLWHKKHKTDAEYFAILARVSEWNGDEPSKKLQQDFDSLINEIFWLQQGNPDFRLADTEQQDLDKLFAVIAQQPLQREFDLAFELRKEEIVSILERVLFADKMLAIRNGKHALAVMFSNDRYELYDPENISGVETFNNIAYLAEALISVLAEKGENIIFWLDVFDLAGAKIPNYPDSAELILELLQARQKQGQQIPLVSDEQEEPAAMDFLLASRNLANIQATIEAGKLDTTPILAAMQYGMENVIPALIEQGADINARDSNGVTPILLAIEMKDPELIRMLVQYGANLNLANPTNGDTPLILAMQKKQSDLALLIIEHADLNITDATGTTPLMYALMHNNFEVAEILIARGDNVNIKNKDGISALQIAISRSLEELEVKLREAGAVDKENYNITWNQHPIGKPLKALAPPMVSKEGPIVPPEEPPQIPFKND